MAHISDRCSGEQYVYSMGVDVSAETRREVLLKISSFCLGTDDPKGNLKYVLEILGEETK